MSTPILVEYILDEIKPTVYYKLKFDKWDGNPNSNIHCPFAEKHKAGTDKKPSFSVNINDSGGCYCHACGTKVASIIHCEKLLAAAIKEKISDEQAASRIYHLLIHPVLASIEDVENHLVPYLTALRSAPLILKKLQDELMITENIIAQLDLGWDLKLRRVTIPIFDKFGQLVNIRLYRLPSMRDDDKYPKILNTEGYGSKAQVYPVSRVQAICRSAHRPKILYWFTGERDTILAWDKGLPALCYTTGENVCKKEWAKELKDFNTVVGIVRDNDKAGKEGATKRHGMLQNGGVSSFIVELPEDKGKDFSEFIENGGTVEEFLALSKNEKKENESEEEIPDSDYYEFPRIVDPRKFKNLGNFAVYEIGRNPTLLNKPITVRAIVSGKMERTYSIPHTFQIGDNKFKLPISREMLQLVREHDVNIDKLVRGYANTKAKIVPLEKLTVTEVEIIPMIQPGVDFPYVNQRCYFFGPLIECNKPYEMVIVPTTDMSTQETIGMIVQITPISNILDSYKFTKESCEELIEEFGMPDGVDLFEHIYNIANAISENYTRVYHREDLHVIALLTWIAPLQFEFPFEGVQRGWLNSLVLGDTETGKSKVCQKLTALFHCGVFINAESCSYVGLVGGAVKSSSGMFLLRWGKIPLYNRQLVVVEELSGLTTQEISYMSEVRSAGIARYDKAGLTGETSAKTRLICLSNVREKGKSLGDFNTGVQAALQLVGQNEDLARFDLILTATDDEVDSSVINKDRSGDDDGTFSSIELQRFQDLIMFAWSLKPEQIDFTLSAYRACLQQTLLLSAKYHPSLPVFKAGSGRLKLARIALAIACLQMAWDVEKEKLIVTDVHVNMAAQLLEHLYSKPSFGYSRYSKIQYDLQKVLNQDDVLIKLKEVFGEKVADFYQYVSYAASFTKFEIADALGVHNMYVERAISQMFLSNLLKKGDRQNEWTLSRAGRKWIERQLTLHKTKK
jgi:hypothetical protein